MKSSALVIAIAAAAPLAARAPGTAAPARPAVSITWVRPNRLQAARRAALARVLVEAVDGRPLAGVLVKDSRPQVSGGAVRCGSRPVSVVPFSVTFVGSDPGHARAVLPAGASTPGESGSELTHSKRTDIRALR